MEVVNNPPNRRLVAVSSASGSAGTTTIAQPNYQLTELKNVPVHEHEESHQISASHPHPMSTTSSNIYTHSEHDGHTVVTVITDDEMTSRVIDGVRNHPCLYDPNHENYGSKPGSIAYRNAVWQDISMEINVPDIDPSSIQQYWKRIRDGYVRERRRRIESGEDLDDCESPSGSQSRGPRYYDEMRWIDEFLMESHNINHSESIPHSPTSEIYYLPADEATDGDVMISGYHQPSQRVNTEYTTPNVPNGMAVTAKRVPDEMDEDCSSPGSEISVGSNGLPAKNMQQSPMKSTLVHASAHGIQVQSGGSYGSSKMSPDGGITLRTSQPQMVGQIKKDPGGLMLVDPGPYYQTGSSNQKVYRLVNVNGDLDPQHITLSSLGQSGSGQPRRKRIALVPSSQLQTVPQSPSMPSASRGRIGDDLILDDGIQESTIVIDNHCETSSSPMLADSPGMNSMLIGGHSQMVSGSGGVHSMRQMSRTPTHHIQQQQPMYTQYDADVAFQALIASHLNRLNEEEKAVMKFNIQRILLDARFGSGTATRMMQEELNDAAANSVVAHEMVSTNPR